MFAELRTKLNEKEKELLELQRAEPSLLAPESTQTTVLFEAISSLHLSTQDGAFFFAPATTNTVVQGRSSSTGVDSIKTLPSNVWLAERKSRKGDEPQAARLPMVSHLLSLPVSAFLSSNSTTTTTVETTRLPVIAEPLPTPVETIKSSPKSLLDGETVYSKEFWLRKPEVPSSASSSSALDLDKYIEQTSEKMRRLHTDYLAALEQLKMPSPTSNSTEAIRSLYPQVFNRVQTDTTRTRTRPSFPSN